MGDIYDEILNEQPIKRCKFGIILEDLDPDDRAGLERALADPKITNISVVNVLTRRGMHCDRDTMSKHMREKCVCFR